MNVGQRLDLAFAAAERAKGYEALEQNDEALEAYQEAIGAFIALKDIVPPAHRGLIHTECLQMLERAEALKEVSAGASTPSGPVEGQPTIPSPPSHPIAPHTPGVPPSVPPFTPPSAPSFRHLDTEGKMGEGGGSGAGAGAGAGAGTRALVSAEESSFEFSDELTVGGETDIIPPKLRVCHCTDAFRFDSFNPDLLGWESRCHRPLLSVVMDSLHSVLINTVADNPDTWRSSPFPGTAGVNLDKALNFFAVIDAGYVADNFYHNATHAASVVWDVQYYLGAGKLNQVVPKLQRIACVLAAAVHDYRHPGVNNAFLINTNDHLAITHNDDAVLERYHSASAFATMSQSGCDLFSALSKSDYRTVRANVISMVLATDVSRHIPLVGKLNALARKTDSSTARPPPHSHPSSSSSGSSGDDFDVDLIVSTIVVLGDLGHAAKKFLLHEKWTLRITEEFYLQGDRERAAGLAVSPLCDRESGNMPRSQIGFFQYLVLPLFRAVAGGPNVIPIDRHVMRSRVQDAEANFAEWKRRADEGDAARRTPPPLLPSRSQSGAPPGSEPHSVVTTPVEA